MYDLFFLYIINPCNIYCTSSDRSAKALFPQVARQVLQFPPSDIRCPTRAWKVFLLGEGADDAGGVFDDTIAEMCEVSII